MDLNVLKRVLAEYRDMRGLKLTMPQAARLWSLPVDECRAVLEALVATGHLHRDEDGQFALRLPHVHTVRSALRPPRGAALRTDVA